MNHDTAQTSYPAMFDRSGRPEGMIDFEACQIIRDLIRVYGFNEARARIANYLIQEANR